MQIERISNFLLVIIIYGIHIISGIYGIYRMCMCICTVRVPYVHIYLPGVFLGSLFTIMPFFTCLWAADLQLQLYASAKTHDIAIATATNTVKAVHLYRRRPSVSQPAPALHSHQIAWQPAKRGFTPDEGSPRIGLALDPE
jgi:hypothetical protein